jgi:hypothetical protein
MSGGWWVMVGGGARVDLRCRQCKSASARPGKLEQWQRVVCASETQLTWQATKQRLTFFRCLFTTRAKKAAIRKARGCVGSDGPPGFHILPQTEFRILAAHCNAFRRLTDTHTHLGLPRPGPTGWRRRGSQWCQLPGYCGFLPLCAGAGKSRKSLWSQKVGRLFFLARIWIPAPRDGRSPVAWRRYCLMGPGLTNCGTSGNGAPPLNPPTRTAVSSPHLRTWNRNQ